MNSNVSDNKKAWEYRVYEWRVKHQGYPKVVAKDIVANPKKYLRYHSEFFNDIDDKMVANICGSDGRRAVALAVLGAKPTVFDLSEEQKRYALELANEAGVNISYEVGDVCLIDESKYANMFEIAYAEGGILHYFQDLNCFFLKIHSIMKNGGCFVLSDYHPFQKTCKVDVPVRNVEQTKGNYFDDNIHMGHVPYYKYFSRDEQIQFPHCWLRFYTLSEIINSMINVGFCIESFWEHPKVEGADVPFEFTIVASVHK